MVAVDGTDDVEKGRWSLSSTADHTDGFVTAIGVLGAGYNEEIKPITWLTAQAAFDLGSHLQLTFEGNNLLDAEEKYTLGGNPLLSNGYNRYGRSFTLGASLRL